MNFVFRLILLNVTMTVAIAVVWWVINFARNANVLIQITYLIKEVCIVKAKHIYLGTYSSTWKRVMEFSNIEFSLVAFYKRHSNSKLPFPNCIGISFLFGNSEHFSNITLFQLDITLQYNTTHQNRFRVQKNKRWKSFHAGNKSY